MSDRLPPRPAPIPSPDRTQIERLNSLYDLSVPSPRGGWRTAAVDRLRGVLARLLFRQQEFNAAVVDHINRDTRIAERAHEASLQTAEWLEGAVRDMRRQQESLAACEQRMSGGMKALSDSHDEIRSAIGVLQQASHNLKRQLERVATSGSPTPAGTPPPAPVEDALDSHKYVAFEDKFRGARDEIRRRVAEYLPVFEGAQDVIDLGCGRGEFLLLLRDHGIPARGVDINAAMVELCRSQTLDVVQGDGLTYLRAQRDGSVGGLFAAQVIEHLEPRTLMALLDTAFDKLRPGAPIVLETINPACWFAFFESYIRDITHVRPIHPETLKYLLVASGFQHVDIQFRMPYPQNEKLQPIPHRPELADQIDVLNANVERLNNLLFTFLDYAAIGRRA